MLLQNHEQWPSVRADMKVLKDSLWLKPLKKCWQTVHSLPFQSSFIRLWLFLIQFSPKSSGFLVRSRLTDINIFSFWSARFIFDGFWSFIQIRVDWYQVNSNYDVNCDDLITECILTYDLFSHTSYSLLMVLTNASITFINAHT